MDTTHDTLDAAPSAARSAAVTSTWPPAKDVPHRATRPPSYCSPSAPDCGVQYGSRQYDRGAGKR